MFRLIVVYEISFILFWNILYHSSSGVENWFQEKFVTAIFTVLSTMVLGFTIAYIIYMTLKISGISDKLKSLKDPRKT